MHKMSRLSRNENQFQMIAYNPVSELVRLSALSEREEGIWGIWVFWM